jgi:hypothetical protein
LKATLIQGFPVASLAFARTVRLVSTARLRDPVLLKLVDAQLLNDLAEIEGATSGRLAAQSRGAEGISGPEFVSGMPHSAFINAAFAYFRPGELNRFNGPGRGAWYAALNVETCLAEVIFHISRELARVNDFNAIVDYAELFAGFAGDFVDLRGAKPIPLCLHPDTTIGYPAGNILADAIRGAGVNGIVYPAVRHATGTNIVALWPHAVQSVAQGQVFRVQWNGNAKPSVNSLS